MDDIANYCFILYIGSPSVQRDNHDYPRDANERVHTSGIEATGLLHAFDHRDCEIQGVAGDSMTRQSSYAGHQAWNGSILGVPRGGIKATASRTFTNRSPYST
jgi:hypothetical protein